MELVQNNVWTEKILCADRIERISNDTTVVFLQQPMGAILGSMAWAGALRPNRTFMLRNARQWLDEPGEFYFDRLAQRIYYYAGNEDMTQAEVIAPISHGLLRINGKDTKQRVEHLAFEGITFAHDTWGLMETEGSHGFGGIQSLALAVRYVPGGNWHPTQYNSTDVPTGTIDIRNASHIRFLRNRFTHLGSATALSMVNDVTDSRITANTFIDLLGNAINIGHPQHYRIVDGNRFPSGTEGVCRHIEATNNYIRTVSLDFRQAEGMTAFFVEDVHFNHNDIAGTPYGCIAMGWWWGNAGIPPSDVARNNSISFNKAGHSHRALNDGGIIYLLGEQPGTVVEGNYLFDGPRCIYPDDGSAYLNIHHNVIENNRSQLWLHIWHPHCHDITVDTNYVTDHWVRNNCTNGTMTNTFVMMDQPPMPEAEAIRAHAGIEPAYRDIIPAAEPTPFSIYPFTAK